MLIEIIAVLFDFKIKVLSFSSTNETCDYKCKDADGKMPYLHQVRVDSLEYFGTSASKGPLAYFQNQLSKKFTIFIAKYTKVIKSTEKLFQPF